MVTKTPLVLSPNTSAILPVHCHANPCDTRALRDIATRHGIPLIYDAAHCFGARDEGPHPGRQITLTCAPDRYAPSRSGAFYN